MKLSGTWIVAALLGWAAGPACAQLQPLSDTQTQRVFGGGARLINVRWHNAGNQTAAANIQANLLQATSATVTPFSAIPWKNLRMLPQQTVIESAQLDLPAVKAETKFLVQWIGNSNQVLGLTEIQVYPTNLLGELKTLFKSDELGVLDPNGDLKPVLKQNGIEFINLETMALDDFCGKLAIVGPFRSPAQMRADLAHSIRKITAHGAAVVWLQPPAISKEEIIPSFYVAPESNAAVVVVQPELTAHFTENPQSQLNLVYFCKLALNPEPFLIPNLAHQP